MNTSAILSVPTERLRLLWDHQPRGHADYVLYWMTAARRPSWNFALDRALELAHELNKPLLVLEALRVDYPWASDRLHSFVLRGMLENQAAFAKGGVAYYPYVEPSVGAGKGLLHALAESACAVITDDSPMFFLPAMLASARLDVAVRFEAVDSNGLWPTRAATSSFTRAYDFRRHLQRELPAHLLRWPSANPLAAARLPAVTELPKAIRERWPAAALPVLRAKSTALAALPIDHGVLAVSLQGGAAAAEHNLARFLESRLAPYAEGRNQLELDVTSGLSAHLHFGHISAHEIFGRIAAQEDWSPERLGREARGKREGWWGMGASAEAYLDQLVTWRELSLNAALHQKGYDKFESIPDWAQKTLAEHAHDPRPRLYDLASFERAETHDELWNAAQRELLREGRVHGYLRMLWGKKILHWSQSPRQAHEIMLELNNKYALDGRDPNSHSGILWTLGKFDRAWGPERGVFGKVRFMTSANTRRKLRVASYLERWSKV